jgi:hypothetical protein
MYPEGANMKKPGLLSTVTRRPPRSWRTLGIPVIEIFFVASFRQSTKSPNRGLL